MTLGELPPLTATVDGHDIYDPVCLPCVENRMNAIEDRLKLACELLMNRDTSSVDYARAKVNLIEKLRSEGLIP
jgi:hypothetical protein